MKILKQVQDDKICSTQSGFYRTEMFLVIIIDPATSQDDKQVKNRMSRLSFLGILASSYNCQNL